MGRYRISGVVRFLVKSRTDRKEGRCFAMGSRQARRHRRVSNPALVKAMRELLRSSAASRHVLKKYKGSRAARMSRAIRDSKDQ